MELNPILNIDVGGQKFRVLRETVMKYPQSLLAQVITGKDIKNMLILDSCYFFDRNPRYFSVILDYMRIGKLFLPSNLLQDQMKEEMLYWKIDSEPNQIPESVIESTLVIDEKIEPTLLITDKVIEKPSSPIIEPTILLNTPNFEPTLLIQENLPTELKDESPSLASLESQYLSTNNIKIFRAINNSQSEAKKDVKIISFDNDELLSSLIPETKNVNRTLPWANKDLKKTENDKKKSQKTVKEEKLEPKNSKKEDLEDFAYESSFIDDDDFSLESEDFKPKKRKNNKKPQPATKKLRTGPNNCKKSTIPNIEELSSALAGMKNKLGNS